MAKATKWPWSGAGAHKWCSGFGGRAARNMGPASAISKQPAPRRTAACVLQAHGRAAHHRDVGDEEEAQRVERGQARLGGRLGGRRCGRCGRGLRTAGRRCRRRLHGAALRRCPEAGLQRVAAGGGKAGLAHRARHLCRRWDASAYSGTAESRAWPRLQCASADIRQPHSSAVPKAVMPHPASSRRRTRGLRRGAGARRPLLCRGRAASGRRRAAGAPRAAAAMAAIGQLCLRVGEGRRSGFSCGKAALPAAAAWFIKTQRDQETPTTARARVSEACRGGPRDPEAREPFFARTSGPAVAADG